MEVDFHDSSAEDVTMTSSPSTRETGRQGVAKWFEEAAKRDPRLRNFPPGDDLFRVLGRAIDPGAITYCLWMPEVSETRGRASGRAVLITATTIVEVVYRDVKVFGQRPFGDQPGSPAEAVRLKVRPLNRVSALDWKLDDTDETWAGIGENRLVISLAGEESIKLAYECGDDYDPFADFQELQRALGLQ